MNVAFAFVCVCVLVCFCSPIPFLHRFIGFNTSEMFKHEEALRRALVRLHNVCIPALATALAQKRHPLFDSGESYTPMLY